MNACRRGCAPALMPFDGPHPTLSQRERGKHKKLSRSQACAWYRSSALHRPTHVPLGPSDELAGSSCCKRGFVDSSCAQTLLGRLAWRRLGQHGLCTGLKHHRSVSELDRVAAVSFDQGCHPAAHAAGPAGCDPCLHPHQQWQAARRGRAGHAGLRDRPTAAPASSAISKSCSTTTSRPGCFPSICGASDSRTPTRARR